MQQRHAATRSNRHSPAHAEPLWHPAVPRLTPRAQGAFISSKERDKNRAYLEGLMGEELAAYILDLMDQDAQ